MNIYFYVSLFLFFLLVILLIYFRKGEKDMAVVYATLIINGKKEFSDVPAKIKEQVRQVLIDLDLEELTEE